MSVGLVGPHASMPDDVRLSDRMFCVLRFSTLDACYVEAHDPQPHAAARGLCLEARGSRSPPGQRALRSRARRDHGPASRRLFGPWPMPMVWLWALGAL
eukprot:5408197-Prymnesium_polylepis.1